MEINSNEKIIGRVVCLQIMATQTRTLEKVTGAPGSGDFRFGYFVSNSCEDDEIGIRVVVAENGVRHEVQFTASGELNLIEGSFEEFMRISEDYVLAW